MKHTLSFEDYSLPSVYLGINIDVTHMINGTTLFVHTASNQKLDGGRPGNKALKYQLNPLPISLAP